MGDMRNRLQIGSQIIFTVLICLSLYGVIFDIRLISPLYFFIDKETYDCRISLLRIQSRLLRR